MVFAPIRLRMLLIRIMQRAAARACPLEVLGPADDEDDVGMLVASDVCFNFRCGGRTGRGMMRVGTGEATAFANFATLKL